MKNVTVGQIKLLAKQRSDLENTNVITPAEWLQYINGSYSELYDLLVAANEDYYTKTVDVSITSGNSITLPADFYKMRALDGVYAGEWLNITQFAFNQRNRRQTLNAVTSYPYKQYRLVSQQIIVNPVEDAKGDYRLWYIPAYTTLTSDASTLDGVNGWEEYIVIDAAIKAMIKQEQSVTDLMVAKANMIKRIEKLAANRNNGEPESINDTQNSDDYFYNGV